MSSINKQKIIIIVAISALGVALLIMFLFILNPAGDIDLTH